MAQVVHGSICCAQHGCAVSCIGDANDDVLIGMCPHDGATIAMASPKYFADHAKGIAAPFDVEKAIAKHGNKHIAHMFEDDGVTLKEEYRDATPAEDAGVTEKHGDGLLGEMVSEPEVGDDGLDGDEPAPDAPETYGDDTPPLDVVVDDPAPGTGGEYVAEPPAPTSPSTTDETPG